MNFDYPHILTLFEEHTDPNRSESASFLIWYLENYYRLDTQDAVDSVCDQRGDKGIDGIYVNDDMQTITVFQSRISQKNRNTTIGDVSLKELAGTLQQLKNREGVNNLIRSAGEAQVSALLQRLNIADKIADYELSGEFLSNIEMDSNSRAYLAQVNNISFVGRDSLHAMYISDQRDVPISTRVDFDVLGFQITEYTVDADSKALIAPIRARELVRLDGIVDQAIFTHNVRGPLGSTNVNKDIVHSIQNSELHKKFPLFHNGITIIAGAIDASNERICISDYFVVNGCQSLTALFKNKSALTDDLYVLTKFIKVEPTSALARQITEFSNNQNGVRARDFKSNSRPQIRLQNEVKTHYSGIYEYAIKRGEVVDDGVVISNEDAGLYLMAFDLKEPWATHRKYQIFDDKHSDLFGRPGVTAHRIVMLHIIREEIDALSKTKIENTLFGKYVLTRYLIMYLVRAILDEDRVGRQVVETPEKFVKEDAERQKFRLCICTLLVDVIIDLNVVVKEYGNEFDYRGRLRDDGWVKQLKQTILKDYLKQVARARIPSFSDDWESRK